VDYATDTVHVNSKVTFAQLSQSLQLDEEKLKMLNPSYKLGVLPHPNENGKSHVLRLPYHKAISFTDLKENIYASSYPNYYRQQAAISESIAEADNKQEETLSSIHKDTRKATTQKPKVAYYRVRRGDGLYTIASRYGCSVQDIKRWNRLHSQAIHPGQVLTIYKG
jgi:membrane-bound lytic murein transglycosylase D